MKTEVDVPDVFGSTIFCDDIRYEIDQKVTFVGCYNTAMQLHAALPLVLPKFGFGITLWQRRRVATQDFVVNIYLPDDGTEPSSVQLRPPVGQYEFPPMEDTEFAVMGFNSIVSPLTLKAPGAIRVRAEIGDKEYRLGSLRIIGPPAEPVSPSEENKR